MEKEIKKHGGARAGAGATPKSEDEKKVQIHISIENKYLKKLGGKEKAIGIAESHLRLSAIAAGATDK